MSTIAAKHILHPVILDNRTCIKEYKATLKQNYEPTKENEKKLRKRCLTGEET